MLAAAMSDGVQTIQLEGFSPIDVVMTDLGDIAIEKVVTSLAESVAKKRQQPQDKTMNSTHRPVGTSNRPDRLPTQIVSLMKANRGE